MYHQNQANNQRQLIRKNNWTYCVMLCLKAGITPQEGDWTSGERPKVVLTFDQLDAKYAPSLEYLGNVFHRSLPDNNFVIIAFAGCANQLKVFKN